MISCELVRDVYPARRLEVTPTGLTQLTCREQ